jgi:hypothetical protein
MLLELREGSPIAIIDQGSENITTGCGSGFNTDWLDSYFDFVGGVLEVYLLTTITQDLTFGAALSGSVNSILDSYLELFTTPLTTRTGTCNTITQATTLVDTKQYHTTLEPNQQVMYMLISSDATYVGGGGNWHSRAGIASDFHLAGVVTSGIDVQESASHCCSDKFASYTTGSLSFDGVYGNVDISAPRSLDDAMRAVGAFLVAYGTWYSGMTPANNNTGVPNLEADHNRLRGFDCFRTATDSQVRSMSTSVRQQAGDISIVLDDDLVATLQGQRCDVSISAITGQLVSAQSIFIEDGQQVYAMSQMLVPPGVYIMTIGSSVGRFSHKVFLNQ